MSFKKPLAFLFFLFLVSNAVARDISNEFSQDISLNVGEVKTIFVGSVVRVAVGREDLLSINVLDDGNIVLIPLGQGITDFIVWREGGRVAKYAARILPTKVDDDRTQLDSILRQFPGVIARVSREKIILEGTVSPVDYELLNEAIKAVPNVISLVRKQLTQEEKEYSKLILESFTQSFPDLNVRIIGNQLAVEGSVDPSELELVEKVINNVPNAVNLIRPAFSTRDMININVTILEVDKNYSRDLGIDWSDVVQGGPQFSVIGNVVSNNLFNPLAIPGPGLPVDNNGLFPFLGFNSTLTSTIQLIEDNGAGRILAKPTLSARSGESASFLAGGEVPFQVLSSLGQPSVEFFDFGIMLDIEPYSDGKGGITAKVNAEVSTLDTSILGGSGGIPGKLTRNTNTTINVSDGETIAISGLVSVTDTRAIDKLPFLGDIPVLGNLFKSKQFQEQRTELVILVTPTILDRRTEHKLSDDLLKNKEQLEAVFGGNSTLQKELLE